MLMFEICYMMTKLEMEDVHAEATMRETSKGSKSYEKTTKQQEEWRKQNADRQKEFQKRLLDEKTAEECGEQRKQLTDRQKEYRKRKLEELTS